MLAISGSCWNVAAAASQSGRSAVVVSARARSTPPLGHPYPFTYHCTQKSGNVEHTGLAELFGVFSHQGGACKLIRAEYEFHHVPRLYIGTGLTSTIRQSQRSQAIRRHLRQLVPKISKKSDTSPLLRGLCTIYSICDVLTFDSCDAEREDNHVLLVRL